jgi:hypothetical protein
MGIGEMVGMRWVLWGTDGAAGDASDPFATGTTQVPAEVFEQVMQFVERALDARDRAVVKEEL